jgi:alpha-tubulin suppressor-like RCC1 family protein
MKFLNINETYLSAYSYYGKSVAINSGDIFAISAPQESLKGKVYVYKQYEGEWNSWKKIQQIELESDSIVNFGYSIDINNKGDILAVSAPLEENARGAVYIYTGKDENWYQVQKIIGDNAEDYLGWDLKLNNSGNKLIVGSYQGVLGSGFANLYIKAGDTWVKHKTFSGTSEGMEYGTKVSINSGNYVFIAAPNYNGNGEIFVYSETGNWNLLGRIKNPDNNKFDFENEDQGFGKSISVTDDAQSILIGANKYGYSSNDIYSGRVYLFEYDKDSNFWFRDKKYSFPFIRFTGNTTNFGTSVAINNSGNLFFASSSDRTGTIHGYLELNSLVQEDKQKCYKDVFPLKDTSSNKVLTFALRKDDSIVAFGNLNEPDGKITGEYIDEDIIQGNVKKVTIADDHSFILTKDGNIWGLGQSSQFSKASISTGVTGFVRNNVVDIISAIDTNMVLLKDGRVTGWGDDWRDTFDLTKIPANVQGNVTGIAFGGYSALALLKNGTVSGWGSNQFDRISIPQSIQGYVTGIDATERSSLFLISGGWATGIGYDSSNQFNISTGISGKIVKMSLGCVNTLFLLNDGSVTGYGDNTYGQLNFPTGISGKITGISAGCGYSMVVLKDGTVTGFGYSGGIFYGYWPINPPTCPSIYPGWQKYLKINDENQISGDFFGESIALNRDGNTMIVGNPTKGSAYLLSAPWDNYIDYFGISTSNITNYCICDTGLNCRDCCGIQQSLSITTGYINNLNNLNLELSLSIKNLNCSPTYDIYKFYNYSSPLYTDIYKLDGYSSRYTKNISIKNIKPINNLINLEWKIYNLGKEYKFYTGLNINNY